MSERMNEKKVTKAEVLKAMREILDTQYVDASVIINGVSVEDIYNYITVTTEQIQAKADKAKAKAKEKAAAGDELQGVVLGVMTDEITDIDTITEKVVEIAGADVTRAKVTNRLSKLFNAGLVRKDSLKVDNRKVVGYALAATAE